MILTILTTIIIIGIFCITFIKYIKKNNNYYIYILAIEFVGIAIDLIMIFFGKKISAFIYTIIYILSVIIPIIVMYLENKKIYIGEIIGLIKIKLNDNREKEILINIIEKYPNSYLAHKKLAIYYEKNKETEKAEDEYYKTIELKTNDYNAYCELSNILVENNKIEDATNILEELLKIKPDCYNASMILGNILYNNEQFKEAIIVYNEALKYKPSQYDIYYELGMTYTRLNDFQNAKEYYKKAAMMNSYADIANLNLGQIYLIFRDYEKAEKFFYSVINSDDDIITANAYYYLAKISLEQHKEEQAIQYANLAVEIYPRILKIIQNDSTFITILVKIKSKEKENIKTSINIKKIDIIKYLGKTYNVVEKLTDDMENKRQDKEMEK